MPSLANMENLMDVVRIDDEMAARAGLVAVGDKDSGGRYATEPFPGARVVPVERGAHAGEAWNACYATPGTAIAAGSNRHFRYTTWGSVGKAYEAAVEWCKRRADWDTGGMDGRAKSKHWTNAEKRGMAQWLLALVAAQRGKVDVEAVLDELESAIEARLG